jgi:multicomponent Na+:H+ antiporter subunit E
LAPRMRIHPGFGCYRTELKIAPARTFFTNCVSLLPGTLAADIQDEWIEVHVLNIKSNLNSELVRLEHIVARLFAEGGDTR